MDRAASLGRAANGVESLGRARAALFSPGLFFFSLSACVAGGREAGNECS